MRFQNTLVVAIAFLLGASLAFSQTLDSTGSYGQTTGATTSYGKTPDTTQVGGMPAARARRTSVPVDGIRMPPTPATSPISPLSMTMTAAPVHLSPGDLLDIGVFDTPELSGRVRVNSEGAITLPLIGALKVGGLTPEQVLDLISRRLKDGDFMLDPQVSVFVDEYANQAVYVVGEVARPGPYPLMGSHRLLDFISAAGGLTPVASKAVVVKSAADPDQPRTVQLSSSDKDANPELAAGDTVVVAPAGIVYCLGEVRRPGGFILSGEKGLTVVEAVALAEGTTPTASLSKARLIRTTPQGREEIPINLKNILKSQTADLKLQADDIVFIPGSKAKDALVGAQAMLPAAAAATIYRVP